MGNYLTKIKDLISSVMPTLERTKAKKRKRVDFEHDFAEALMENGAENRLTATQTDIVNAENEDDVGESDLVTNGVSLSQLNNIMNRMNQDIGMPYGPNSRNRIDPDLESVLFSRNRLRNLQSHLAPRSSNRTANSSVKLFRTSPMQSNASTSKCVNSGPGSLKNTVDMKLTTPARKKMRSTTEYIYSTLFLNGENSDLCITALNKEWKLHKIYLCQSPYFDSMFKNGSRWLESTQSSMEINIPDENINENALYIAFGSFYKEDIEIVPLEVVNVLACASLFSLDGLIAKCAEIMIDNINFKSVIGFYEASLTYGVKSVTDKTLQWLSHNLMTSTEFFLADLKLSLFEEILSTKDLLIIQVETDLYTLCKKWLYFQLNKPLASSPPVKLDKNWQKICNEFFKNLIANPNDSDMMSADLNDSGTHDVGCSSFSELPVCSKSSTRIPYKECLLDRPSFAKYRSLFKRIRLQHILADMASLNVLYSDRIIPHNWFEPHYLRNWLNTIYIDQDMLSHEFEITPEDFDSQCARFGRALADDSPATWRWVGYNYGIDHLISHTSRTLTIKRSFCTMYSPYHGLVSQKTTQRIYYVMKVVQLDSFGNEKWSTQTPMTCVDLSKNEEKFVLTIDSSVQYPVLLSFRVVTHPYYAENLMHNLFN